MELQETGNRQPRGTAVTVPLFGWKRGEEGELLVGVERDSGWRKIKSRVAENAA